MSVTGRGMAEVAARTGDETLLAACKTLWNDVVNAQLYVTGGVGSTSVGEAFTFDYDLPNDTVYAETCASIALAFFGRALFQADPDSAYADVIERVLFNALPAAMTEWTQGIAFGAVLGVLYMVLRPIVRLLLKVLNWLTLGLLYVAVDTWLVWTAAALVPGAVTVDNVWWAVAVAAAVNVARTLISALTGKLRE